MTTLPTNFAAVKRAQPFLEKTLIQSVHAVAFDVGQKWTNNMVVWVRIHEVIRSGPSKYDIFVKVRTAANGFCRYDLATFLDTFVHTSDLVTKKIQHSS